jgi:hypothetical protein
MYLSFLQKPQHFRERGGLLHAPASSLPETLPVKSVSYEDCEPQIQSGSFAEENNPCPWRPSVFQSATWSPRMYRQGCVDVWENGRQALNPHDNNVTATSTLLRMPHHGCDVTRWPLTRRDDLYPMRALRKTSGNATGSCLSTSIFPCQCHSNSDPHRYSMMLTIVGVCK